jgi:hypothetical protein
MASFPPKFGADGEMDAEDEKEGKVREEVERFGKMLSAAQRDEKEAFGSVFKVRRYDNCVCLLPN